MSKSEVSEVSEVSEAEGVLRSSENLDACGQELLARLLAGGEATTARLISSHLSSSLLAPPSTEWKNCSKTQRLAGWQLGGGCAMNGGCFSEYTADRKESLQKGRLSLSLSLSLFRFFFIPVFVLLSLSLSLSLGASFLGPVQDCRCQARTLQKLYILGI